MNYPSGYFFVKGVHCTHYVHYWSFMVVQNKGHLLYDIESSKASGHFEK
jgi:hypothetical protein